MPPAGARSRRRRLRRTGAPARPTGPRRRTRSSRLATARWTWPLEPSSPGFVFARKLARRPIDAATCFTPNFSIAASSAAASPRRASTFKLEQARSGLRVHRGHLDAEALERGEPRRGTRVSADLVRCS